MDRCRYCGDLMPPDAFRPGYCEPCEDEGKHVCGGRDPMYPGQTCTFPPGHDWPCIDPAAVDG